MGRVLHMVGVERSAVVPGDPAGPGMASPLAGVALNADPRPSDRERVNQLLLGLVPDTGEVQLAVVPGDPISKARPRFVSAAGRTRRAYTPRKTILGERRLAASFSTLSPFPGNVAVACLFFRSSHQRVDVDNLLKAVLDAATGANVWEDDSQVTALVGVLDYDVDYPRTLVAFGSHAATELKRGRDAQVCCEACGRLFFPAGHQRRERARWCSRKCRAYLAEPVCCLTCETPFKRRSGNQKYCSVSCRAAAQKITRPCVRCGQQRARPESTLCRSCFRSDLKQSEPRIAQLWLEGASTEAIGAELGISSQLVSSRVASMRKRGIELPRRRSLRQEAVA